MLWVLTELYTYRYNQNIDYVLSYKKVSVP